jgi:hypothetical protein
VISQKRWYQYTKLRDVASRKTVVFILPQQDPQILHKQSRNLHSTGNLGATAGQENPLCYKTRRFISTYRCLPLLYTFNRKPNYVWSPQVVFPEGMFSLNYRPESLNDISVRVCLITVVFSGNLPMHLGSWTHSP